MTQPAQLTAADRCDRCNAQAYTRWTKPRTDEPAAELLYCAHHTTDHEIALDLAGWTLDADDRPRLHEPEPEPA